VFKQKLNLNAEFGFKTKLRLTLVLDLVLNSVTNRWRHNSISDAPATTAPAT